MATYTKRGKTWRASIARKGVRKSATFQTKAEAVAWATKIESEIIAGKRGAIPNKTFGDLLDRYRDDVSPKKKGSRWESIRLNAIKDMVLEMPFGKVNFGDVKLADLDSTYISKWRDDRLKSVKGSTVNRDWNLLSNVCAYAVDEWKWLQENPFSQAKRPKDGPPRDKLISEREIERLLLALGYDYDSSPDLIMARVGSAFLFAIETGMRAGEIAGLTWDVVNIETRVAKVLTGKSTAARRYVPLSSEAIRILKQLPEHPSVFNLTPPQIDSNFRDAKKRAMIDDITFHDTRHLAITRLSKKLDVLALARMVGHKDIRELMTYYNETAESMAQKLG